MGCVHGQKNPHKVDMGEPKHNKKMMKMELHSNDYGSQKYSQN